MSRYEPLTKYAKIKTGSSNVQDASENGAYYFFDRSDEVKRSNRFLYDCSAIIVPGEGMQFVPKFFNGKFDLHQRAYAVVPFAGNDAKYLYYAIDYAKENFVIYSVGTTVKSLRMEAFEKMPILKSSFHQQRKIAEVLSTVDEIIEKTTAIIEKYTAIKHGLMQVMLNDVESALLGDKRYFTVNRRACLLPNTFYYIDLEAVVAGKLIKSEIVQLNDAPSRAQRLLSKNDILFQMVRPYQGNNYFFEKEFEIPVVASTGYAQIKTSQNSKFVYYALHAELFLRKVMNSCTGSNYPAINTSALKKIAIPLPSRHKQDEIAEKLTAVDEKIETERNYLTKLLNIKKGLMQDLLTNKISVEPLLKEETI